MSGKRNVSGKNRRRKSRGKTKAILAVLIIVAIIAVIVVVVFTRTGDKSGGSDTETVSNTLENADSDGDTEESSDSASEDDTDDTLPEVQQSSSLTLSSVYTSSILNPDCGGEYAEEIASLEVTNSSDQYLLSAELTAVMSDGTEVIFSISDLPAGDTAEIFDTGNQTLAEDVTCTSLVCTSEEYLDEDVLMSDTIEVRADGSDAVIANTGGSDLTELTVVYHCDMAGQYFGGASYTIKIDYLAAGESYTLSDSTLMGEAAVVRVYQ